MIDKINRLASQDEPFLFVINYQGDKAFIRQLSDINPEECLFDFEGRGNSSDEMKNNSEKIAKISWQIAPPLYEDYERSFDIVKNNIMAGNSYLTNLTCKVPVSCNLSLEDIFHRAKGKYKLLLRRKRNQTEDKAQQKEEESQNKADKMEEEFQNKTYPKEENIEEISNPFVCFSPETFVRIKNGRIYSCPMKGTLDASLPDAEKQLMEDRKEAAEHATIVDLIRNDLSRVAENVGVDKYRYIDVLHTNKGDILQTSSEISGRLPEDYRQHLGEILDAQLPAGSITCAPQGKTMPRRPLQQRRIRLTHLFERTQMIACHRCEAAQKNRFLPLAAARLHVLQKCHLRWLPFHPRLEGIKAHIHRTAHVHHSPSAQFGKCFIISLNVGGRLLRAVVAAAVAEVTFPGNVTGRRGKSPVPQHPFSFYKQLVPRLQALLPAVIVVDGAAGRSDFPCKDLPQLHQIFLMQDLADFLQRKALVAQIANHLHLVHALGTVIAVTAALVDAIGLQQAHFLIIAQRPRRHVADFAHLSNRIQSFFCHGRRSFPVF